MPLWLPIVVFEWWGSSLLLGNYSGSLLNTNHLDAHVESLHELPCAREDVAMSCTVFPPL